MSSPDNYTRVILRTHEAIDGSGIIVSLREMPSPNHSWNRWPEVVDVRIGTVYGEGQNYQTGYLTGTMPIVGGSGGTVVYTFVG